MNKPAHTSCPVVRVTAYGATAYTSFYGRRLPSANEWLYAVIKGGKAFGKNTPTVQPQSAPLTDGKMAESWPMESMNGMIEMMPGASQQSVPPQASGSEPAHFPAPVLNSEPNELGIRGLNENISEWGLPNKHKQRKTVYIILGGFGGATKPQSNLPARLPRKPWEAFEEVSFRTVANAPSPLKEE